MLNKPVKFRRLFLLIAVLSVVLGTSGRSNAQETTEKATDISVRAKLDKTEYHCAVPFEFQVEIVWFGEPGDFDIEPPQKLDLNGLELLQSSAANETTTSEGRYRVIRRYSYVLLPVLTGVATIGQVQIHYKQKTLDEEGKPAFSERLGLATSPLTLSILPQPKRLRVPWKSLGLMAGFIVSGALFFFFLRRRRTMERPVDAVVELSAEQQFLDNLQGEEHLLVEGEIREFFVRTERALLTFLRQRTGLDMSGKSAADISELLADRMTEEDRKVLEHYFETTHLVKFAGQHPEREEIERIVRSLGRSVKNMEKSHPDASADKSQATTR